MPGASGKHASPRRSVTSPHWVELDAIARGLGTTGAALAAELIRERVEANSPAFPESSRVPHCGTCNPRQK